MGGGVFANFNYADIEAYAMQQIQNATQATIQTFQYVGETFVREARSKSADQGGFHDITGNLRSSIGYILLQDGIQITSDFQQGPVGTDRATGVTEGMTIAESVAAQYPKGIVLVVVAGMDYAAAVEAKGKDVITGTSLEVETLLKDLLGR